MYTIWFQLYVSVLSFLNFIEFIRVIKLYRFQVHSSVYGIVCSLLKASVLSLSLSPFVSDLQYCSDSILHFKNPLCTGPVLCEGDTEMEGGALKGCRQ